jgi:hypothetical protein
VDCYKTEHCAVFYRHQSYVVCKEKLWWAFYAKALVMAILLGYTVLSKVG